MNLFNKCKKDANTMATILKETMCMNCTVHSWSKEYEEIYNIKDMEHMCPTCWNFTNDFYKNYLLAKTDDEKLQLKKQFKELQIKQRQKYEQLNI